MKWPWDKEPKELTDAVEKHKLQDHEEIERRVAYLESQVKVLKERAELREGGQLERL
jgi:3-dehydroquinate dehydratase